ncbi:hypothetical protein [Streptomyces aidingensis]|uniref:Uncharacterized protein n=1 Tax=Streptomyces aidingensis TaxID=910347 RepID=A0A1I1QKU6_9ACTN|nr:hypothetical protein [Streptomyces aidingensis]SFD20458.1 hypothetical protein SAMN05421773_11158 [Streptomyces aidingensis]
MYRRLLTMASLVTAVSLLPGAAPAAGTGGGLHEVREATARYKNVWGALADGYELASPCVPGMGFHFLGSVAADQSELVATEPNVLVYAPLPDGGLRLVAVEYASFEPASLFGRTFDPPSGEAPFHTLHAWVWQDDPDGMFAAQNPGVSCDV